MDAISQTTFSSAFSVMKLFEFPEVCSKSPINKYSIISLDNGLAPTRHQAMICTNDG